MADVGEETISLERHLGGILENSKTLMKSYRNHLLRIYGLLKGGRGLKIEEGDYCIRFNIVSNVWGLNRFFFLYEIGDVTRRMLWRSLLRSSMGLGRFLLHKRASFLPSYSFSFDRPVTFVYWGEKQPLLNPDKLRRMELESFVVSLENPSRVICSSANIVWPKAINKVYKDQKIVDLAKDYLFNALFPPKMANMTDVWSEAPFVIISDDSVELFTIHKTICSLDYFYARRKEEDYVQAFVNVLDSDLSIKRVKCYISRESLEEIKGKPVAEVIISKRFKVHKLRHPELSSYSLSLHPFESTKVFEEGIPSILTTVASIILRSLYFRSSGVVALDARLPEIRDLIIGAFARRPFDNYSWKTLGSQLLKTLEGTQLLLELLGVYRVQDDKVMFIHPSIVECALSFLSDYGLSYEEIRDASMLLAEMIDRGQTSQRMSDVFNVQEMFKEKMGLNISFKDARELVGSLHVIRSTIIPLSKRLNSPYF